VTFINDVFHNLILFLIIGIAIATIVGMKYADKYPDDAKRLPVRAGQTIAGWLFKLFKGR
jgi:hypothetical protein